MGKLKSLYAEHAEGRSLTKGNPNQQSRSRTQCRQDLQLALARIREAAEKDKDQQFTALWHHVYNTDRLTEAYYQQKRNSATGVDGETWSHFGENLELNIQDLSDRLKRGAYRARPVKRVYIPKPDGRQRPIGIPTLEDKIVQRSTAEVLNAIYETEFKGFSHGFRPGRSQHDALDAVSVGITHRKIGWVLDADIRGFFDAIDHDWLMKFIKHKIADRRILRHVKKWLKAGILEKDELLMSESGTPQGGSISPLLANIYLHYVFDLWADLWRKNKANGDMIIVRYADDIIVGFQHRSEAKRFLEELIERFAKFNLELHSDKTRLIEFGRYAIERRKERGAGRPKTFDFLGFTHSCSSTRQGYFIILRQTSAKKIRMKLKALKMELRRRLHAPVHLVGKWLGRVLQGHYQYYGVPFNSYALNVFRRNVIRLWYRTLRRRSDKTLLTWIKMYRIVDKFLPHPRILHPYPNRRLRV